MEWIKVSDRLPFPMQRVFATDGISSDLAVNDMINWYSCDSDGVSDLSMNEITHWLPLPISPVDK